MEEPLTPHCAASQVMPRLSTWAAFEQLTKVEFASVADRPPPTKKPVSQSTKRFSSKVQPDIWSSR